MTRTINFMNRFGLGLGLDHGLLDFLMSLESVPRLAEVCFLVQGQNFDQGGKMTLE